jgi:PncC family amidohydrolase
LNTPLRDSQIVIPTLRQIQSKLKARGETVATAESCTGGLVASYLTELAGSSEVYLGGVSAYANAVKVSLLGVALSDLNQHGAVSAEVAQAMAAGVRDRLGATYGLSLTGVAGPSGGSPTKPVGTVYCGIATPDGVDAVLLKLSGDRSDIRTASALAALEILERTIGSTPEPSTKGSTR